MASPDFSSYKLKIRRADEHAETLDREIGAWEKAKPYVLVKNCDAKGYFRTVSIRFTLAPDLDRWSLVFGDFVHNLRSALDHLVYAIAVSKLGTEEAESARTQFPIVSCSKDFPNSGWMTKCAVRASIESIQPYKGPDRKPLSLIRDFDNADKHRLLNLCAYRQKDLAIRNFLPPKHDFAFSQFPEGIVDGSEIFGFTVTPPIPDMEYEYDPAIFVAVRHGPPAKVSEFSPLLGLLSALKDEVRSVAKGIDTRVPR